MADVWIMGATGRTGRAVAEGLASRGIPPTLVGRDRGRLAAVGDHEAVVSGSIAETAAEIRRRRPAVVVNTVGDYARTAADVARACLAGGGHYLDLANDLVAVPAVLALDAEATAAGSTLITAGGFGAVGTEALVARMCAEGPGPSRVRVDALASVGHEGGAFGTALAATVVDVLTTGGRQYRDGRLVRAALGGDRQELTLPDGGTVRSASAPAGELAAAQRTSGAPDVTVTTALAPAMPGARFVLPVAGALLSVPPLRRFALGRLARVELAPAPMPRPHSWGHAVLTWPDGTTREGWLRTGDAMDFTTAVLTEMAARLVEGEGRRGAHAGSSAFGPDVATAAGADFLLG